MGGAEDCGHCVGHDPEPPLLEVGAYQPPCRYSAEDGDSRVHVGHRIFEQFHYLGQTEYACCGHYGAHQDGLPREAVQVNEPVTLLCGVKAALVPFPLPQADEGRDQIIGVESEGCIQTLTEEYPHSCKACKYAHQPHGVLLPDLQNNINHPRYEGEDLHHVHITDPRSCRG